jgi:hypothetical protein
MRAVLPSPSFQHAWREFDRILDLRDGGWKMGHSSTYQSPQATWPPPNSSYLLTLPTPCFPVPRATRSTRAVRPDLQAAKPEYPQ